MTLSIPQHIVDGAIVVESIEAFGSILKEFPDNPHLLRIYAGMLASQNLNEPAGRHYGLAAESFLRAGRLLPALVSKSQQWLTARPTREQLHSFHSAVDAAEADGTIASDMIKRLTPPERQALFSRFEITCLPRGTLVRKNGEPETALWGVVVGRLKESTYQLLEQKPRSSREPVRMLQEGDFFGDVYPFSSEIISQYCIETATRVELVGFPVRRLIQISRQHPRLEQAVLEICQVRLRRGAGQSEGVLRKGERYAIPARMSLEILSPTAEGASLLLEGRSLDVSLSGLSFIPEGLSEEELAVLKGTVGQKVRLTLPVEEFSLTVGGQVARVFPVSVNGRKELALGIQFSDIAPSLRGAFFIMAGSNGNGNGAGPAGSSAPLH